jgi:hypothetical protein
VTSRRRLGAWGSRLAACGLAASGVGCFLFYDPDDFDHAPRLNGCWYRLTDQVDDPATPESEAEAFGEAWFVFEEDEGSISGCFARLFRAGATTECPFEETLGSLTEGSATEGTVRILAQNAVVTVDLAISLNEEDPALVGSDDGKRQKERIDDTLRATVRDELLRDAPFFAKGPFKLWRAPDVREALCPLTCGELVVLIDERPAAGDPPGPICGEFAGMTVQP